MDAFLKTGKLGSGAITTAAKSDAAGTKHGGRRATNQPWVEKYRPRTMDDVAYQDEVVAMLKKCVQGFDLPNLLFYGSPGTGKTSTILAVCHDLFGPDFRQRVLELNASDERGIAVIRVKVKSFSQMAVPARRSDGKACPPLKMVILDEVDSMTSAAQAALRRTMEKETKTTRFCLICNYVSRIIDPLTSRCAKFRFKPLAVDILSARLQMICKAECVECDDVTLRALVASSGGDLRKAITTLQSMVRLYPLGDFDHEAVHQVTGMVPWSDIDSLLHCCQQGVYDTVSSVVQELIWQGHGAAQVLQQLFERLMLLSDTAAAVVDAAGATAAAAAAAGSCLASVHMSRVLEQLAVCECRLMDGGDEFIQLMDVACSLIEAYRLSQ